jgi:hypothetical protein
MATTNAINNTNKTTVFLADGTFTKDSRTQYICLYMVDSGDGGMSGARFAANLARGGGGGAGGGHAFLFLPASLITAPVAVKIGVGGIGGTAQTSNDTAGKAPTAKAQKTSFGEYGFTASRLPVSGAGGLSSGLASIALLTPSTMGAPFLAGGLNTSPDGSTGAAGTSWTYGGASGGGNNNTTARAGGDSLAIFGATGATLVAGAAGGIEGGTINGGNGTDGYPWTNVMTPGTGGAGGGGQKAGGVAGNGGNGAFPGGGGGGGGASINGTNSGAGGNGGAGLVIVVEYF